MIIKNIRKIFLLASLIFFASLLSASPVSARVKDVNYSGAIQKTLLFAASERCYSDGILSERTGKLSNFNNLGQLFIGGTNNDYVKLPNGLTNMTNNSVSCANLYLGDALGSGGSGTFEGLFSLSGKKATASVESEKKELLQNFGYYKLGTNAGNQQCINFRYSTGVKTDNEQYLRDTDKICANLNSDNTIKSFSITGGQGLFSQNDKTIAINNVSCSTTIHGASTPIKGCTNTTRKGIGDTWEEFRTDIVAILTDLDGLGIHPSVNNHGYRTVYYIYPKINIIDNQGDIQYQNKFTDGSKGKMLSYLSNGKYSKLEDLKLSEEEEMSLDIGMLKNYYYDGVSDVNSYWKCGVADWATEGSGFSEGSRFIKINIDPNGQSNDDCRLTKDLLKNADKKVMATNDGYPGVGVDPSLTFDNLIERINSLADAGINAAAGAANDGSNGITETNCFSFTGSVGWRVCDTTEYLADGTDGIYETLKNALTVDTRMLETKDEKGNNSASYEMWGIFRDFANICVIIIVLVVIFSQFTGVGIDNYGIKKMLPRIIIAAILINVSYFVCRVGVDLSNIVGTTLSRTMTAIADNAAPANAIKGGFAQLLDWLIGLMGGAGAGAAVALPVVFTKLGGGSIWPLLIPLIISIITALICVLLFFVMLSARELIIIACVIASPLALACYILPGTQKLFKKWGDIFKAMLVLFPICSALYGVGYMVKILTWSKGASLFKAMLGSVASVLPYLAAPALLKSSLNGLGSLGAKLSGLSSSAKNLGAKGTNAMKNTDTYQDSKLQGKIGRGTFLADRLNKKIEKGGGTPTDAQKRRLGRYTSAILAGEKENYNYSRLSSPDAVEAARIAQEKASDREALAEQMTLVNARTNNGEKKDELKKLYREAAQSGNISRCRAIAEIAGRRKDTATDFLNMHDELMQDSSFTGNRSALAAAVTKQIATGDNSKNYRAADGVRFEYASQYNRGDTSASFEDWQQDGKNLENAISHHVVNGADLYGQKGSSLEAILDAAQKGKLTDNSVAQLRSVIATTKSAQFRSSGAHDATKDEVIQKIEAALATEEERRARTERELIEDALDQEHMFDS